MVGSNVPSGDAERLLPRRLRKSVAQRLKLSLQQVDECWHAGRLRVVSPEGGEARQLSLDTLVFDDDRVLLDGVGIGHGSTPSYALLNKPKHVTSTARDPDGKSDLAPYLRAMPPGCFAVGRLDRETTGLLLFTSDGDLASAVLRPDHRTTKTYWLWLDEAVPDEDPRLRQLTEGVCHHGELLIAQSAHVAARTEYATELELTLVQGKNRQIRNMCYALDFRLVHLHRTRIGPLTDAGLAVGAWRLLADSEVEALWQAAGGRSQLRERQVAALMRQAHAARVNGAPQPRLERWLECEVADAHR